MKKILLTIICCLTILLYIPFNTFAEEYNDDLKNLPEITELQLSKIQSLFNSHTDENLIIFYSYVTHNLAWSYNINSYDSSNKIASLSDVFILKQDGTISSLSSSLNVNLNEYNDAVLYLFYNNNIVFKNSNLIKYSSDKNTLLLSTSYENIVRSQSTKPSVKPDTRYYSYVDYDIRYTIKGTNFDVYYLVNNTYKLIQSSINSFTIFSHESKSKFKDSSIQNDFPDYPSIPNNKITTYDDDFKLYNFLFKISDLNSNELIVKAPDTDSLLSDGNSNSQSATSNNNKSNQLLDNTVNQLDSLENEYKSGLNTNLNNINSNDFKLEGIERLTFASDFVRTQFNNLTLNNPFGTILGFSLFLGLSLLIIGKRL